MMVWIIVLVGVGSLALAGAAAAGGLGAMPDPIDSRHTGRLHGADVDEEFLSTMRIPRAFFGYAPHEVDDYRQRQFVDAEGDTGAVTFRVVLFGYSMEVVDETIDRTREIRNNRNQLYREEKREPDGSDEATHR